uniref:Uncharacterized protein n=1 Tax=Kalanchoe fedtschenkoi TaxID=63787 RepID=A0A7N0TKL2_KALFE
MLNYDNKFASQCIRFLVRFGDALTLVPLANKPDSKYTHLTSPVSTLNPRASSSSAVAVTPANSGGSSSSSFANPNFTQFAEAETHSSNTSFTSPTAGKKLQSTSFSFPSSLDIANLPLSDLP